jgi:pullulanase
VGLPPHHKNEHRWPYLKPLLANAALKPSPAQIAASKEYFLELLRLRYSTPLLRLAQAEDVIEQVTFYNTGPAQVGRITRNTSSPSLRTVHMS